MTHRSQPLLMTRVNKSLYQIVNPMTPRPLEKDNLAIGSIKPANYIFALRYLAFFIEIEVV